jgi:uncharacterized membrane protein
MWWMATAVASEGGPAGPALVTDPVGIIAVLLATLAGLFAASQTSGGQRVFRVVPLLVFAYFVPTLLSNVGVIPLSSPAYDFVKRTLLPASLVLLVLAVDVPSITRLGRDAILLLLAGTAGIVIGGPVAYLALGWMVPGELGDEAWKGLAALAGSWIGGGANFVAIGESVGASDTTMSLMVVVDVAVANVWMAILLGFAGNAEAMDARIGADARRIEELRKRIEDFKASVSRPLALADLLVMLAIAFGVTWAATELSKVLPPLGDIFSAFTWVVVLCTTAALALSFTPLRKLEGAGASAVGSAMLYLLVATIGAKAEFAKVLDYPALVAVGALWMCMHATFILVVRRLLKAPIFFAAVGSQANVGGAASAPVVASAFHPALAPVGVLLAIAGYVLGTYAGLLTAWLLQLVHGVWH